MAKLTGAKKKAFLERMAKGRRKAARGNPAKKAKKKARKNPPRKKAAKKKAAKKNPTVRKSKKVIGKGFSKPVAAEWAKEKRRAAKSRKRTNPTYVVWEKVRGSGWRQIDEQTAKSGAEAIRITKTSQRQRGNLPPSGTKYKATTSSKNPARRNSDLDDAVAMYQTFHQKAPGHIVEYEELVRFPGNFAELGKLRELRVFLNDANPEFGFTHFGQCQVVCTPDGQNIYFNGGDQSIDYEALGISSEKDVIELGPCVYIDYHTTKGFHDFEPTNYWHRFGEENGVFPRLGYDRLNKRLFLIGGDYTVKREGIVN